MDITERKITKIAREAEKLKASKAEIEASFYAYLTDTLTREEADAFAVVLDKLYTVSYICAAWMKKPVQQAGAAYKKAAGALSAATLDRAQNAVTYRICGCESAREARYEEALDSCEKTAVRSNVRQSALPPLYLAISEAGVLFILWFGAKNVLGTGWSAWDIAAFTTFLSCFTKLTVKSSKAAKLFNAVQKAEVSWKRIKPLMKAPETLEPLTVPAPADVTLENLSFAYGDTPVFSGLTLTAHPGDIIGVTGPVACGKSTLGRVFLCEAPYGGSARFGEKEFSALTPRQAAAVGYLGHDPELSADTIRNNVLCGNGQDAAPYLAASALDKEVLAAQLDNRRAVAAVSGQVPETLHNIRTIRMLGLEAYMERRYDRRIGDSYAAMERAVPPEGGKPARGDVVLSHVTFGYGERPVLHDFSMTVRQGEQVTLVGRTGAGKSTVFKLLLGLYQPQAGSITIGGVDAATIRALPEGYATVCTDGMFSRSSSKAAPSPNSSSTAAVRSGITSMAILDRASRFLMVMPISPHNKHFAAIIPQTAPQC